MRRMLIALAVTVLGLAACGTTTTPGASPSPSGTATAACTPSTLHLYQPGQLTVATDSPAYSPWFVNNNPSNGKGYESAVAYAIAQELGFTTSQVKWVVEPFDSSYAPGPKKFDFDINEISATSQREQAVTFSDSYYDTTQALVALKSNAIVAHHSPADLPKYLYGDQIGTTSLAYIQQYLKPTKTPAVFDTLNDVKAALDAHRIDAFVTDTPTAQYISSSEIPGSTVLGQFPSTGEHYGLLFEKGNPLVGCVDQAIAKLKANGTLARLQQQWLGIYNEIPTIQP